jgi:hypothetical protein
MGDARIECNWDTGKSLMDIKYLQGREERGGNVY